MKNILILLSACLLCLLPANMEAQNRKEKKADEQTKAYRYEIQCYGTGVEGTYSLKVWSFSKKPEIAREQCKKNAIHGVIFKGVVSGPRCSSQPPLSGSKTNLYNDNQSFFDSFLSKGGKYMQFVNISNDGVPLPGDVVKISKKEYKVGLIVSVRKDALRKYLEDEGIIKKLSDGF